MKKTHIDMSKVKDYNNPFNDAVWTTATPAEEEVVYNALASVDKARITT